MAKIASAARHGLSYILEDTHGITPANPQLARLRHTTCALGLSRDSFTSAELRLDRQINDVRTGCDKIAGSIGFEPSWAEYDQVLEACLAGTWTNNILKCGVEERSFTMERHFPDIGKHIRYRGCFINQMTLSLQPNAMISGTWEIIGLSGETADKPLCETPTPAKTGRPYDSYRGNLKEGDETIAVVTGIELTLNNGIEPQFVLFDRQAPFVTWGNSTVTGTMTAFFEDVTLIHKFLDETPTRLEFLIGFPEEGQYRYTMPNIMYTGADNPVEGEGPVSVTMPFTAVLDHETCTNLMIERIPANSVSDNGDENG